MNWWHALKGVAKYRRAMEAGDVRSIADQDEAAGECARCPHLTAYDVPGILGWVFPPAIATCGPIALDLMDLPEPTCGCVVLAQADFRKSRVTVTVGGRPMVAAGKPEVGSEKCPQGKW